MLLSDSKVCLLRGILLHRTHTRRVIQLDRSVYNFSLTSEPYLPLFALRHLNTGTYAIWDATDGYALT